MKRRFTAFFIGLLFALGLGISGMTDASKVFNFLNLAGDWDPSLAFVMVGAIGVHLGSYRWILKRKRPAFADRFALPTRTDINSQLVLGAAVFGVGWGLGGFCPGPAVASLAGLDPAVAVFVAAMVGGMLLRRRHSHRASKAPMTEVAICGS